MNGKFGKNVVYAAAFILITLISLFYKLFLSGTSDWLPDRDDSEEIIVVTDQTAEEPAASTSDQTLCQETQPLISVYVCGEVNNPGVYELSSGSIVNDAVEMAGGFTQAAQVNRINLVYIIESNVTIYIPGTDDDLEPNEFIRPEDQTIWGGQTMQTELVIQSSVNINTASREQLMSLPGIGAVTADAIIEYREQTPFDRVEDIMNVTGIGEAKFNSIRDLICV